MLIFTPTDLDEQSVNMIFKQCLASAQTQKPVPCVLFQTEKGFAQASRPIFFDGDILEEAKPVIEFVLGQLKAVHLNEPGITAAGMRKTYLDTDWTENKNLVIALLHLALAAGLISPPDAKTGQAAFTKALFPTLSTVDPGYAKWEDKNISTLKKMYHDDTE